MSRRIFRLKNERIDPLVVFLPSQIYRLANVVWMRKLVAPISPAPNDIHITKNADNPGLGIMDPQFFQKIFILLDHALRRTGFLCEFRMPLFSSESEIVLK